MRMRRPATPQTLKGYIELYDPADGREYQANMHLWCSPDGAGITIEDHKGRTSESVTFSATAGIIVIYPVMCLIRRASYWRMRYLQRGRVIAKEVPAHRAMMT